MALNLIYIFLFSMRHTMLDLQACGELDCRIGLSLVQQGFYFAWIDRRQPREFRKAGRDFNMPSLSCFLLDLNERKVVQGV